MALPDAPLYPPAEELDTWASLTKNVAVDAAVSPFVYCFAPVPSINLPCSISDAIADFLKSETELATDVPTFGGLLARASKNWPDNEEPIGLLNLLDHLKTLEHKPKIIFPSTRLVYKGKIGIDLTESSEKEFKTIYASSKYNGELYLNMYHNLYNIN